MDRERLAKAQMRRHGSDRKGQFAAIHPLCVGWIQRAGDVKLSACPSEKVGALVGFARRRHRKLHPPRGEGFFPLPKLREVQPAVGHGPLQRLLKVDGIGGERHVVGS